MAAIMQVFRDPQTNIAGRNAYVKATPASPDLAVRMVCAPGNKDLQLVLGDYIAAFVLED